MAPEMIQKELYCGNHIDVWAIGVIIYAMLAGSMPFNGKTEEDLFMKIRCGQYRSPAGISYDCKRLLSSILHLDSMKRPSASDLFYDPWNAQYFRRSSKSTRKTQNKSMQKLIKNFSERQQVNN
jgi:serine/threonine protein kinase